MHLQHHLEAGRVNIIVKKVTKPKPVMSKKRAPEKVYFGYIIGLFLISSNKCIYYTEHGHWREDLAGATILDKTEFDKVYKRVNSQPRKYRQVFVCKCRYNLVKVDSVWNYITNSYSGVIVKKFKSLTRFHPFQALEHLIYKL
jgi:hypothetical protein